VPTSQLLALSPATNAFGRLAANTVPGHGRHERANSRRGLQPLQPCE
jgi:hypothetical protein